MVHDQQSTVYCLPDIASGLPVKLPNWVLQSSPVMAENIVNLFTWIGRDSSFS